MPNLGIDILFNEHSIMRLLVGLLVTLKIALFTIALSWILGIILGVLRTTNSVIIRATLRGYLEVFRAIPILGLKFLSNLALFYSASKEGQIMLSYNFLKRGISLFYLLGMLNIAFALEVSSENEYYYIKPENPEEVYKLILANAPSDQQHLKVTGQYISKVNITGNYEGTILEAGNNRCVFSNVKIHLHGRFILPKLKSNLAFGEEILATFHQESKKIIHHEKKHEQITIDGLLLLKEKLESMANKERTSCQLLEAQVKKAYDESMANIEQKNRAFDCNEYGDKIGIAPCKSTYVYEKNADKAPSYPNAYKALHSRPKVKPDE